MRGMKSALLLAMMAFVSTLGCAPVYVEKSSAPNDVERAEKKLGDTEHAIHTMGSPALSWSKFHVDQFEKFLDAADSQVTLVKETYGREAVSFMGSISTSEIRRKLQYLRKRLKSIREEISRLDSDDAVYDRIKEIQKVLSNDLGTVVEMSIPDETWSEARLHQFEVILKRLDQEDAEINKRRVQQGLEPWPENHASERLWKALDRAWEKRIKEPAGDS